MTELRTIREGGNIQRFHTRKMIQRQDVAQHSFNAALIAESIAKDSNEADTHRVVMHMLLHDIPELGIGDTPGHIKAHCPQLKAELDDVEVEWAEDHFSERHLEFMYGINPTEAIICKFADLAECALMGIEEMEMGNKGMAVVVDSCIEGMMSVHKTASTPGSDAPTVFNISKLLSEIIDKFDELGGGQ